MKHYMNHSGKYLTVSLLLMMIFSFISCEKSEDYELITYLKKTYGPVIVGQQVDFSFAIASNDNSSLKNFEISATYAGKTGTTADTKCYWTLLDGKTYSKDMLTGITTTGNVTSGSVIDGIVWQTGTTSGYSSKAVTIRYSYIVPEEARGKNVQFTVKYTDVGGSVQSYSTMNYPVEKMDMVKDNVMNEATGNTGRNYFSISELKAYTKAEVEAQNKSAVIDFVYRYNTSAVTTPGGSSITLGTCISAPSQGVYLTTSYVPATWTKNATLIEIRKWDDMQLKGNTPNSYVTDMDLESTTFNGNTFGEYGLKVDFSLAMQTADGKYRAFVYLKTVGTNTVTIGVKRLAIK
jgi:hypothetical protein